MYPSKIGNYEILGEIGRGAMGVVYHAHDPGIGRPVAIKVIRIDGVASTEAGAQLRHRLMREASAAGNLSHPGIVTVHQLGEDANGVYVVMELVPGQSLERLLGNNPRLDPRQTIEILRQTADALDYAHRAGVVHRDVKPGNILLRNDGVVKVADFGIAKMAQASSQSMTAAGSSIGSPSYMSPEQVRGEPVDGRSDQFSLAVLAYEMLLGRLPFRGDSAHSVMFQIVGADPFQRDPASLPPPVVAVLSRALAKDASHRFPSCAHFVYELRRAMFSEPAATGEPTSQTRPYTQTEPQPAHVATPAKPRKTGRLIAVAVVLLACAGIAIWLLNRGGSKNATPQAADALIKAVSENRLDDARKQIDAGTDVNAANADGMTALMQAAEGSAYMENNAPAVTMLVDKGANIDQQDKRGRTSLYRAAAEGKDEAMRILLAHKANPNQKAADGSTPLLTAIRYGKMTAVNLLLHSGADVNGADSDGDTPLMIAAEGTAYLPNNAPLVTTLLNANAHVDTQDHRGRSALYRGAGEGKTDAVRILIDKKADPNLQANDGTTPLMETVTYGKQSTMQLLLEHGADVNRAGSSGDTPLMIASEGTAYIQNNAPYVLTLLAANATVDAQDSRGRSALYRASTEGKEEAMQALLDHKANPNLKSSDGSTPLIQAVTYNKTGAAKLLLDHGADVNLADGNGTTALMVVAEGNPYIKSPGEFISLLLSHGAKKDLTDSRGRTLLARAEEAKNTAAIELLKP